MRIAHARNRIELNSFSGIRCYIHATAEPNKRFSPVIIHQITNAMHFHIDVNFEFRHDYMPLAHRTNSNFVLAALFGMFAARRISNAFRSNTFCPNEQRKKCRKKIIAFFGAFCFVLFLFFIFFLLFFVLRRTGARTNIIADIFSARKKIMVFIRLGLARRVNIAVADVVDVSHVLVCDDVYVFFFFFIYVLLFSL